MMEKQMKINILYEDMHIIVCEKPPGVPAQSDKTSDCDMVNWLKNHIYSKEPDRGQPYAAAVHRLDRPVGGIMVFAKTPFAAKSLSEQIRQKRVKKNYVAVTDKDLAGKVGMEKTLLTNYLLKNGRTNLGVVTTENDKNGKKAELYFKVLEVRETAAGKKLSLLDIELLTGRHHQIRVQLAHAGSPIWGDTKYNVAFAKEEIGSEWTNIALYAYLLEFNHPKTGKNLKFKLMPPNYPFVEFDLINSKSL